jgi:hypothetical protein
MQEMTFAGFKIIKYLEGVVAAYAVCVGLLFALDVRTLAAEVYDQWLDLGGGTWGSVLILTGLAHFLALWLNGRARAASRIVRVTANTFHLYISLKFAFMFLMSGAPWGTMTFGILLPGLILPILASTLQDARQVIHER